MTKTMEKESKLILDMSYEYGEYIVDLIESKTGLSIQGHDRERKINTEAIEAQLVLDYLSTRYYLVKKSKVEKVYKSAKHDSKIVHREKLYTIPEVASERKTLLESLFPEIAKEVEE